jgi:hypothetical protein
MSSPQDQQQFYSMNIELNREFLKWVYSHRLVDGPEFQHLWDNKPDVERFEFGGKGSCQFQSRNELLSFNKAFDDMLEKSGIDAKHREPLLYMILFLGADKEKQNIENNWNNHLLDYARFITDLIADSMAHMDAMRRKSAYQEVYDEYTTETFFAKREIVASMSYEELLEYIPLAKQADDVIKYNRVNIYEQELHVPSDLIITIQSNKDRKLKSGEGNQVQQLELPHNILVETFQFMINNVLELHKKKDTNFYRDITDDNITLTDLVKSLRKNKKHTVSNVLSLAKVGTLLTDYLIMHKLFKSKRSAATFLFEYFALFKAIILKKQPPEFPTNYDELIPFYRGLGVDGETIRNMMKDVGDI